MKISTAAAACLTKRALDALIESRVLSKADVRAVQGLRAGMGKKLSERLADPNFEPVILANREDPAEEEPKVGTSIDKHQRVTERRKALERDATEMAQQEGVSDKVGEIGQTAPRRDREVQYSSAAAAGSEYVAAGYHAYNVQRRRRHE
jgi:hypothetical protein